MDMKTLSEWFDQIRLQSTAAGSSSNSIDYILHNGGIKLLADHSHILTDEIFITVSRIATDNCYDMFSCFLPTCKKTESSISADESMLMESHTHDYVEIAIVLKGTMHLVFDGAKEDFPSGQICLIRQGVRHHDIILQDQETIILYIGISNQFFRSTFLSDHISLSSKTFLQDIIIGDNSQHDFTRLIPKTDSPSAVQTGLQILDEIRELRPGYMHLITGYCERILYLFSYEYQIELSQIEHKEYLYHIFIDVRNYIRTHYATVSLGQLSDVFGYNPDYFNRLIRRFTGSTYTKLLQSIRIHAAADLLTTTDFSVEEIATEVGYSNLGYFYREFQKMFQTTPKRYRKAQEQARP